MSASTSLVPASNIPSPATASPAQPSDTTVSWQSIFFGLAALALNAMTQRSHFDSYFSKNSVLFAMRSSPFICIADLIEVVVVGALHVIRGKRSQQFPSGGRIGVGLNVGIVGIEEEAEEDDNNSKTIARSHPWVMLILFVGTSTQAVKIFGFEGIIWTKLWAASYVLSYIVVVLKDLFLPSNLRLAIDTETYRIAPPTRSFRVTLSVLALIIHAFTFFWTAFQLIHLDISVLRQDPVPVSIWGVLIRFPIVVMAAMGALFLFSPLWLLLIALYLVLPRLIDGLDNLQRERDRVALQHAGDPLWSTTRNWLSRFGAVVILLFVVIGVFGSQAVYMDFRVHVADIVVEGLCLSLVFGVPCLIFVHYLISGKFSPSGIVSLLSWRRANSWKQAALVTFAVMNFGIAIWYYSIRYDPQGTSKPTWTEKLG